MRPSFALESSEPLSALLKKSCEALKKTITSSLSLSSPVPLTALAVSEPSSPGAGAGADIASVPCRPERVLGSTDSYGAGKSFSWLQIFLFFFNVVFKTD